MPKSLRQTPKITKASLADVPQQVAGMVIQDDVAVKATPQAVADATRDQRLVRDLQDNANRSDLARHRSEISATKEDNEDESEDEVNDEGLPISELNSDPAAVGDVPDTKENVDI